MKMRSGDSKFLRLTGNEEEARAADPERFRRNLIMRRHMEPAIVALTGQEVLWTPDVWGIVRVCRVLTDYWGFEATAVPLNLFHPCHPCVPQSTASWRFYAEWINIHASSGYITASGGPNVEGSMWWIGINPQKVETLRRLLASPRSSTLEDICDARVFDFFEGDGFRRYEQHPPCPWRNQNREWYLLRDGDIYFVPKPFHKPSDPEKRIRPSEQLRCTGMLFIGFRHEENLNTLAFYALLREPQGEEQFCGLVSEGQTLEARLYGLWGLRTLGSPLYQKHHRAFLHSAGSVKVKTPHKHWGRCDASDVMKLINRDHDINTGASLVIIPPV